MTRTLEEKKTVAIVKKVADAVDRAEKAEKEGNILEREYWRGVAHGLNRGWDIHQGCCLE